MSQFKMAVFVLYCPKNMKLFCNLNLLKSDSIASNYFFMLIFVIYNLKVTLDFCTKLHTNLLE